MRAAALTALLLAAAPAWCESPVPLTAIREVHALAPEEAARARPVRVRGVITCRGDNAFIQDSRGAIFIRRYPGAPRLEPGQYVEVEGVTGEGSYAVLIDERAVRVLGRAARPVAKPVFFDELADSANHCRWVEVRGVVRSTGTDKGLSCLNVSVQGGRLHACTFQPIPAAQHWVGAKARVRGALGGRFNWQRQLLAPVLYFSDGGDVSLEQPAPDDPYETPLQSVRSLRQFVPEGIPGVRVRVRGTVTYQDPGRFFCIREATGALLVESRDPVSLRPGDAVEAVGFPAMGPFTPYLEDAVFRRTEDGEAPRPAAVTPSRAASGAHHADLVVLSGLLLDDIQRGAERTLIVQAGDLTFTAHLPPQDAPGRWELPPKGSQLRVTGIWLHQDPHQQRLAPAPLRMLLRSRADLAILQTPSWWTADRLLALVGILLAAILGASAWVWMLRRRVRQQTELIRRKVESHAALEERQRIARDFHDTLQQELIGIVLQLDTAAVKLESAPALAGRCLDLARQMMRRSLAEFRHALWDMRSPNSESLQDRLAGIGAAGMRPDLLRLRVAGEPRRLSGVLETQLVRIAQEAVSNAVKHAGANAIRVDLEFTPDRVKLTVADDGRGFDPAAPAAGHFGLAGMRERADKIGASFRLRSSPGAGTAIEIDAPTAAEPGNLPLEDREVRV